MPRKKVGPVRLVLSSARLKELNACPSQRRRFSRMFGRDAQVRVTRRRLTEAGEAGLRVGWLAAMLSDARDRDLWSFSYPKWFTNAADACLKGELRKAVIAWPVRYEAKHLANALRLP